MVTRMSDRHLPVELVDKWVAIINDLIDWNNQQEAWSTMQEMEFVKQSRHILLLEAIILHHGINLNKYLSYEPDMVIALAETSLDEARWQIPDMILEAMQKHPDILDRLIPTNTISNAITNI